MYLGMHIYLYIYVYHRDAYINSTHEWCVYICTHPHVLQCLLRMCCWMCKYYVSNYMCKLWWVYICTHTHGLKCLLRMCCWMCMYYMSNYMCKLWWVYICTHPHVQRCLLRMRCWMYLLYELLHVYMNDGYIYVHTHTCRSACYVCVAGCIYYTSHYMYTSMMCVYMCTHSPL